MKQKDHFLVDLVIIIVYLRRQLAEQRVEAVSRLITELIPSVTVYIG